MRRGRVEVRVAVTGRVQLSKRVMPRICRPFVPVRGATTATGIVCLGNYCTCRRIAITVESRVPHCLGGEIPEVSIRYGGSRHRGGSAFRRRSSHRPDSGHRGLTGLIALNGGSALSSAVAPATAVSPVSAATATTAVSCRAGIRGRGPAIQATIEIQTTASTAGRAAASRY